MNKIIELDVVIHNKYYMDIEYFFNSVLQHYKKDNPNTKLTVDDLDNYVDENIEELIREIFDLENEEEISDGELDYIFGVFEDYLYNIDLNDF